MELESFKWIMCMSYNRHIKLHIKHKIDIADIGYYVILQFYALRRYPNGKSRVSLLSVFKCSE